MNNDTYIKLVEALGIMAATPFFNDIYEYTKKKFVSNFKAFIQKLDPDKINEPNFDLLSKCLSYFSVTEQELIETYASIINNSTSNDNNDKLLSYFEILSKLTLSDLRVLKSLYNSQNLKISDTCPFETLLSLSKLTTYSLIRKDVMFIIDSSGNQFTQYWITSIGMDFYKLCNNTSISNNILDK